MKPSKLALKLVKSINSGKKDISNMSFIELNEMKKLIVNSASYFLLPSNEVQNALKPVTNAYEYEIEAPFWLSEDTPFISDKWVIKLGKKDKHIDFNVELDDGSLLTSLRHRNLLNSFKYWIICQGNPLFNGGVLLKASTILRKVNNVISLINIIINYSNELQLAKRHLEALTEDVVLSIIIKIGKKGIFECLDYSKVISDYLINKIKQIDNNEYIAFLNNPPFDLSLPNKAEWSLDLTKEQILKSIFYLYGEGVYKSIHHTSNLFAHLFPRIINKKSFYFPRVKELLLNKNDRYVTEFMPVPVRSSGEDSIVDKSLSNYMSLFKAIVVINQFKSVSKVNASSFSGLSLAKVHSIIDSQPLGRFTLLPVDVLFSSMKNAFEFSFSYIDEILKTLFTILDTQKVQDDTYYYKSDRNLINIKSILNNEVLPNKLIDLGVSRWAVSNNDKDQFQLRRINDGLVDLFKILMGSIQVIIGSTMARRQGEIIDLLPTNNLIPENLNPLDYPDIEFELVFLNRKTGVGGKDGVRETISLPVMNSVASLIYKLQEFNCKLIASGICAKSSLSLINSIHSLQMRVSSIDSTTYNQNLNYFCDYFETETILDEDGNHLRYYIRQHQLRRTFVMLFFWSNSFDGLDSLRKFLGHADLEHIYNYVTEALKGSVLNTIKARALSSPSNMIKNHEKLEDIMEQRFGTNSFKIKSVSVALEDYEFAVETSPSLESIKEQAEYEDHIITLLNENLIDLKPEFFTLNDGSNRKDYNLVLHVFDE